MPAVTSREFFRVAVRIIVTFTIAAIHNAVKISHKSGSLEFIYIISYSYNAFPCVILGNSVLTSRSISGVLKKPAKEPRHPRTPNGLKCLLRRDLTGTSRLSSRRSTTLFPGLCGVRLDLPRKSSSRNGIQTIRCSSPRLNDQPDHGMRLEVPTKTMRCVIIKCLDAVRQVLSTVCCFVGHQKAAGRLGLGPMLAV
jgi:hypothetical protein